MLRQTLQYYTILHCTLISNTVKYYITSTDTIPKPILHSTILDSTYLWNHCNYIPSSIIVYCIHLYLCMCLLQYNMFYHTALFYHIPIYVPTVILHYIYYTILYSPTVILYHIYYPILYSTILYPSMYLLKLHTTYMILCCALL